MREQGIFLASEVRQLRRLLAAFVSAEPKLNIHHNNGRKIPCEIQGYEAVNFLFKERKLSLIMICAGKRRVHGRDSFDAFVSSNHGAGIRREGKSGPRSYRGNVERTTN